MNTSEKSLSEFVILCVIDSGQKRFIIPALICIYLISLFFNLLVILTVVLNHQLQTPMFLLISTLSVLDLLTSMNIIPRMLAALITGSHAVPYGPCILQIHVEAHIMTAGSFILSFMAIDRYIAVRYPLRYPSLVTNKTVFIGLLQTNICTFVFILPYTVFLTELPFCNGNVLPSCFCDYSIMVQMSCTKDPKYLTYLSVITLIFAIGSLLLILFSYFRITLAALQIATIEGRKKVFSTCSTHLLVVATLYTPLLLSYVLPGAGIVLSMDAYNSLVIACTTVPPALHPIIYSFRNKEIKTSIYKIFSRNKPKPAF